MTLEEYYACLAGYQQQGRDQEALAALTGYYCGYFAMSKQPKSLKSVLNKIYTSQPAAHVHANSVDVDEFKRREAAFKKREEECPDQVIRQKW